jgi:hypothetical protein
MPVVVEQLPVVVAKYLLSAFAGAIDNVTTARPTTRSDRVFMAFPPNSRTSPEREFLFRIVRCCQHVVHM